MSSADFDLAELASYLHLTPQQVERLAGRGQLPGRKVAGDWRFSRADVHHWMEARMGVLDDEQLMLVEDRLARHAASDADITIAGCLRRDTIAVPLEARTRASVIAQMAQLAARSGLLWDWQKMADAVRQREELQSTALDSGVALLHPRRPLSAILSEPVMALGITTQGIPFGAGRRLTDIFFLIGSVDDRGHLRTLARLSRILTVEGLVDRLRHAQDATAAFQVMVETESTLPDSST